MMSLFQSLRNVKVAWMRLGTTGVVWGCFKLIGGRTANGWQAWE